MRRGALLEMAGVTEELDKDVFDSKMGGDDGTGEETRHYKRKRREEEKGNETERGGADHELDVVMR